MQNFEEAKEEYFRTSHGVDELFAGGWNAALASQAAELVVVTNIVIESLQEEIGKMREAISPGRQNVSCSYYCSVARRLRENQPQIHANELSAELAILRKRIDAVKAVAKEYRLLNPFVNQKLLAALGEE